MTLPEKTVSDVVVDIIIVVVVFVDVLALLVVTDHIIFSWFQ